MKFSARMAAAAGIVLLCALSAHAGDVTGKWTAEFDTQVGPQKYTFELKADGAKLTGKASFERMGQKGEAELKDGKVTGDDISFVEMIDFQGTPHRAHVRRQARGRRDQVHAHGGGLRHGGVRREARQAVGP